MQFWCAWLSLRPQVHGFGLALLCGMALLSPGCATVHAVGKSPLAAPVMMRDSIALEKYSIRFPHADPDLDDRMWSEIDEEGLPAPLRARLAANGFRAGVIGGHMPAALDRVLRESPAGTTEVTDAASPPADPPMTDGTGVFEPKPVNLLHEPKVRRSLWQTRPGHRGIVVTAGEQSRIPHVAILVRDDDGRVTGRSYEKVLGALSLKAYPEPDGRVRIEVIPELEHGDPRSRFIASDGMIKPDYRPDTVLFKDLIVQAVLSPGQTLVLGTRADKPGSLGSHFFTEQPEAQPLEQKLLLIRLAQAPSDGRFRSEDIPAVEP